MVSIGHRRKSRRSQKDAASLAMFSSSEPPGRVHLLCKRPVVGREALVLRDILEQAREQLPAKVRVPCVEQGSCQSR